MRVFPRFPKILLAALFSLGLLLVVGVGTASAHAKVIDSNPKMGSTVSQVPTTITVKTAENMKPGAQFSNLFVYGPDGDLVSQGDATIPLNDPTQMSVAIKSQATGVYIVRWITVSADDNDPAQGAFTFTVGSAASKAPAAQQPATSSTAATGNSGTPVWVPVVAAVVALLVGLGAGVGIGRGRVAAATEATASPVTSAQEKTSTKS
jgi:copper transport protein